MVTEIVAQTNDSLVVGHDIGLQSYCSERKREFMMVVRFLMSALAAYASVGASARARIACDLQMRLLMGRLAERQEKLEFLRRESNGSVC
jgi:hypothetical protein